MTKADIKKRIKSFKNMKQALLDNKEEFTLKYGKDFVEKEFENYNRIINTNSMLLNYNN